MQPGQTGSLYSDVLNRLVDRLHYLNISGEKSQETTRFWFDTRANLRREMEERKRRFHDKQEVLPKIVETLQRLTRASSLFDGIHVITPNGDIPDDTGLRLVVLDPAHYFSRLEKRIAFDAVREVLKNHGNQPRYRQNRLLFLVADGDAVSRFRDAIRSSLAWRSILDDVANGKLNIDRVQEDQAKKESRAVDDAMPRTARECYKWLLCPGSNDPGVKEANIEEFQVNTAGEELMTELSRICSDNELVISRWSAMHLRSVLSQYYWKADKPSVVAQTVWQDTLKFLYLPRLRSHSVFEQAILQGVASQDFFGTALGVVEGGYEGFQLGVPHVQVDESLLLVEPSAARAYHLAKTAAPIVQEGAPTLPERATDGLKRGAVAGSEGIAGSVSYTATATSQPSSQRMTWFHGSADVNAATAKARLMQIADEVINLLTGDPMAKVTVNLEISADFPQGAAEQLRRAVSENAANLKFKGIEWER
jgi:hypothetical protein